MVLCPLRLLLLPIPLAEFAIVTLLVERISDAGQKPRCGVVFATRVEVNIRERPPPGRSGGFELSGVSGVTQVRFLALASFLEFDKKYMRL